MLCILLIDDNPDDRLLVTRQLNQCFSQLEVTSVIDISGLEAALLVGNFDLVITDYQLRWSDGLKVLDAIKSRYPGCPVIMFTDSGNEEIAVEGMKSGLSDYVLKGRPQRLVIAVKESLEKQRIRQEYAAAIDKLQVSEERLRLALEAGCIGTWEWEISTEKVVWSENHERLFGIPTGSFQGNYEAFIACVHPEDRERISQAVQRTLETNIGYTQEYRVVWPDGSVHWILGKGNLIFNGYGQATRMIGVVLDITERKRREKELEETNRLKDEFLAIVSHELRTPLNPILGWAKLLRTRKFDEATRNSCLEIIERNAIQQNQLINDILDTSRLVQGKMQLDVSCINLVTVIENSLNTLRLSAEAKSIAIETVVDDSIGLVMGDENRLQQVVCNLLSNAIKFTPHGGRVEVGLSKVSAEQANTPQLTSPQFFAQITVSDNGEGISYEFLPYVFERFRQGETTTTRSRTGLGLGLAIVRQLVELHGGTVAAQSQGKGHGATFTVQLPLIDCHQGCEGANRILTTNSSHLKDLQILAVDDDVDTLELLTEILRTQGAKVTAVSSGKAALEALEKFQPDVLLSDIGMQQMDGYSLIRKLRLQEARQKESIPAIALTAYTGEEDKLQANAAGFQMFLPKPIDPVDLVNAISSLVKKSIGR